MAQREAYNSGIELTDMPHTLLKHQIKPAELLCLAIRYHKGKLLEGPTGTGKTYSIAAGLRMAQEQGHLPSSLNGKFASIIYLCPVNARIQTERVLRKEGVKNFLVTSHSSMRATLGGVFLDWVSMIHNGSLQLVPIWNKDQLPDLIINDECHKTKNSGALCSQVVESAIRQGVTVINASATPFTKVCEAKIPVMSTGLVKSDRDWTIYSQDISGSKLPTESSPAAIARLKKDLDKLDGIISFEHIYWKHKARIQTALIDFETPEARDRYDAAYEKYLEKLAAIGRTGPTGQGEYFAALTAFNRVAEFERRFALANMGHDAYKLGGKQVIIACKYLETLRSVWTLLNKNNNVPEDHIAFIIGGQTDKARQVQIDDWQQGKKDFCLLSLKAGGEALSLHHEFKHARPREVYIPLDWSPFTIVQVLGRAQRITSLSPTKQYILGYKDTIESNQIFPVLELKIKCLKELITRKDSFIADIFNKGAVNADNQIVKDSVTKLIEETVERYEDGELVNDVNVDCIDV